MLRILGIAAGIIGIFLLITKVHPLLAASGGPLSLSFQSITATVLAANQRTLPVQQVTGVVLIDSSNNPGVPYLVFESANHKLETKELVFDGGRGCQVSAGEFPCVPNIDGSYPGGDVSPVPAGTQLQVQGALDDQALIVSEYSVVSSSSDLQVVTLAQGQSMTLQDGTIMTPMQLLTDPACAVGVGCAGLESPRVEIQITNTKGNATSTGELVSGTFFLHKRFAVGLLNTQSGSPLPTFQFFVARND